MKLEISIRDAVALEKERLNVRGTSCQLADEIIVSMKLNEFIKVSTMKSKLDIYYLCIMIKQAIQKLPVEFANADSFFKDFHFDPNKEFIFSVNVYLPVDILNQEPHDIETLAKSPTGIGLKVKEPPHVSSLEFYVYLLILWVELMQHYRQEKEEKEAYDTFFVPFGRKSK